VRIGLVEALGNAILHVESLRAEVTITDPGPGFDWRTEPTRDGLGLIIL